MTRVPLLSGPYQSRAVIASAQRSINLFPESNAGDPQAPVPVTHYPTPGTAIFSPSNTVRVVRQMYRATNGNLYAVIGPNVYSIADTGAQTLIGTIADQQTTVYFADNGLAIVLVDGTATGYAINMATNAFGTIIDPSFYGADFVVFLDTYFIFNRPNTNQFYISLSLVDYALLTAGTSFDPLDIAAKISSADNIAGLSTSHSDLWLIGELTTEVWNNTGQADFTFAKVQGAFIEHGCVAPYSIADQDIYTFWLSQDREGYAVIVQGTGFTLSRISVHAIEADIQSYAIVNDAIGFCYQREGHAFYILTFPNANKTWAYELTTKQWHEWNWLDDNGNLNRHRANCCAFAYRKNLVGDWQNGRIYELSQNIFTDDGRTIPRIRTFPHMLDDGKRVTYQQFTIDIQTGTNESAEQPLISLRWSDDRGISYGNPVIQTLGAIGEYLAQVNYWRLGIARDRVFEISWSTPMRTALNGAWVQTQTAAT